MENLDFEIEIDLATGRDYPVSVLRSPAGEGRGTLHFPYDELALDNHLTKLQLALLNSGRGQRRIVPVEERTVREFGTALFNAVFTGEVRSLFDVSRHEARTKGTGLRVKLRCRAPELAALPWEFLFDPEVDEYLCLSRQTPVVRYLEVSTPCDPLRVALPLRILGVVASPDDLDSLDVDREKQRVDNALADLVRSGKVELHWLEKPTWRALQQELNRSSWHVIHFVGHGGFDERRDEGVLAFEDDNGKAHLLGAVDVGLLLGDHDSLRLAVLNACEGARSSARDVFSSTAAVLVRKGTPGVVAMQYEITDLAAIELARSFYDCIAAGQPVDTAMSEARKAVRLSLPGTLEWGTPVLFMRAPDGVLFDVADTPPSVRPELPAPAAPTASMRREPRRPPITLPGSRSVRLGALALVVLVAVAIIAALALSGGPHYVSSTLLNPQGLAFGDGKLFVGDGGHHRVIAVNRAGKATLVAGSGADSSIDGVAAKAGVKDPQALAVGPKGALYIADGGNHSVRVLDKGRVTTLFPTAGASGLYITGMAVDPAGPVYLMEEHAVYTFQPGDQALRTLTTDVFNPLGATVGRDGAVYVCDAEHSRVIRVTRTGQVSVYAGNGSRDSANEDGRQAKDVGFNYPADAGFDAAGNLYVLSQGDNSIRKITAGGVVSTLYPKGDNPSSSVIDDIAVSPDGDVYFLDKTTSQVGRIRDGVLSTVA